MVTSSTLRCPVFHCGHSFSFSSFPQSTSPSSSPPCYSQSITKVSVQTNSGHQLSPLDAPAGMADHLRSLTTTSAFPAWLPCEHCKHSVRCQPPPPHHARCSNCLFVANPPCTFHSTRCLRRDGCGPSLPPRIFGMPHESQNTSCIFSATMPRNLPAASAGMS
ncbi:hypothetical protein BKA80DRAFT_282922 [Phyllosticta citrichinensis]